MKVYLTFTMKEVQSLICQALHDYDHIEHPTIKRVEQGIIRASKDGVTYIQIEYDNPLDVLNPA